MVKARESSFRRILVTRILLLFVPVLLLGEIVALNKARASLLKTARQNLTESAISKGEKIANAIATLKMQLLTVSQTTVIQSGSSDEIEQYLTKLAKQLPTHIECLQLTHLQSNKIIASSCGNQEITQWKLSFPDAGEEINIKKILPPKAGTTGLKKSPHQLQLLLSIPVYSRTGEMRYALTIQSALYQQTTNQPGSLTGSTLVIAENGNILAHPSAELVGRNIREYPDPSQLQYIIKNGIAGESNSINLPSQEGKELIVGYTAIANPITKEQGQKWIVLSVTTVDNALLGLEEIKLILIVLTVGLIGASLLASLYLAPYLAKPLEELRDYALNLHSHHAAQPVPRNFKIREFNQLAQAMDQMVERLKAWAEELEIAWKEAKTANQIKSQFLATTSHELRNPLNVIINCVRVVHDGLCDNREEEIEFLKRADETAIHLLGIINELLDISKIEAGKLSVVRVPIDLRQTLLEVINLQSVNVQNKGLQLKTALGTDLIPVEADAAKLKQVLINIIGNATKFTDQGSITIATGIIKNSEQKSQVIVSVTDTGLGIETDQQHKLFRPFVMLDGGATRKVEGTGLGLAISRNLIELMGGSITLESAGINQGTTVKITLPMIDITRLTASPTSENLNNRKVVAEDEAVNEINSCPIQNSNGINGSQKPELDAESCELPLVELFDSLRGVAIEIRNH
ncbi:sensor histidine kinase [Nodularia sp. NIES-3585]|uniref:sensor histidine kinase n=1 Tax=Nodularia sp. NIES-3585 TaxID=1973477 RepID=UPI000B5C9346|nr:hybrid sensor histidine kinase/response regulator [Nodularia sp. NIES-3585]GAX38540.1 integral membrane sensor signal transduction histidine kinase [Nodularia sp. NIES-3585]